MAHTNEVNEGELPNRKPQGQRSISIEQADKDSAVGRNNEPYNKGGEPHGKRCQSPAD